MRLQSTVTQYMYLFRGSEVSRAPQIKSNTPSKQSLAGGVLYLYLRVGCAMQLRVGLKIGC